MDAQLSTENLIETKVCRQCWASFDITDTDEEYLDRLSPVIAGIKFALPYPTMCPDCRRIQRLVWRNEKKIYKRKCDATGADIIALFPPNSIYKIYDETVWNSDSWNAKDYGRDFDFTKTFSDQFGELMREVPLASKALVTCENSDYCNAATALKNCYLTFSANASEDLLYTVDAVKSNTCVDCFGIVGSENCYECIVAFGCYNVEHSFDIKNCRDSRFLLSCEGCSDCYGCFGLTNAQYQIFNAQHSPEEYRSKLEKLLAIPLSEQKRQFEDFYQEGYVRHPLPNTGSENVFDGVNVVESQNVSHSRHVRWARDVRYCQKMQIPTVNLAMDYTGFGNNAEKIYYSQQVGSNASGVYFSIGVFNAVSNVFYSAFCRGINNCFGCSGLHGSESYCILNKQYTREEYEDLVPKIIEHMRKTGEWGEFFPAKLSPHEYDISICQIIRPLNREKALEQWFTWSGYEAPFPQAAKVIPADKLPERIEDVPDDILNWAIECEVSGKPFRIIEPELQFYRKHQLPIPKRHPDQRYKDRLAWHFNY